MEDEYVLKVYQQACTKQLQFKKKREESQAFSIKRKNVCQELRNFKRKKKYISYNKKPYRIPHDSKTEIYYILPEIPEYEPFVSDETIQLDSNLLKQLYSESEEKECTINKAIQTDNNLQQSPCTSKQEMKKSTVSETNQIRNPLKNSLQNLSEQEVKEHAVSKTNQLDNNVKQTLLQGDDESEESGSTCTKDSQLENHHHSFSFQVSITPDSSNLVKTDTWFPIFCNGICRLVWETPGPKKKKLQIFVSGAILDFNSTEGVVSTHDASYKISEKMNPNFLNHYATVPESTALLTVSKKHWVKDIVNISRNVDFHFKEKIPKSGNNKRTIEHILTDGLSAKKSFMIFDKHDKSSISEDCVSLIRELEDILENWQADKNWWESFRTFLHKCGQSEDELTWAEKAKSFCQKSKSMSFCEDDVDIESYEKFKSGGIINSTFNTEACTMIMWAVTKEDNSDTFFIRGLVGTDQLRLSNPEKIISVSQNGRSVSTSGCTYELIGPMYAVAVAAYYLGTPNMKFLEVFQYYFSDGIPDSWKSIVSIMHIICKCSALKSNVDSLASVNSPSYVPSFSADVPPEENSLIFKIPAPIIDGKHKHIQKKPNVASRSLIVSKGTGEFRVVVNPISISSTTELQPTAARTRIAESKHSSASPQKNTIDTVHTMATIESGDHFRSRTGVPEIRGATIDIDSYEEQSHTPSVSGNKRTSLVTEASKVPEPVFINLTNSESFNSVVTPNDKKKKKRRRPKPITFEGYLNRKRSKRVSSNKTIESSVSKKSRLSGEVLENSSESKKMSVIHDSLVSTNEKARITNDAIGKRAYIRKTTTMEKSAAPANKKVRFDKSQELSKQVNSPCSDRRMNGSHPVKTVHICEELNKSSDNDHQVPATMSTLCPHKISLKSNTKLKAYSLR